MKKIQGIIPALITPYTRDGTIHKQSIRELVKRLLTVRVDGFYVCGSTGEAFLLTASERRQILEVVTDAAAERVPVICHVGSISTTEAIGLARHAAEHGATAVSAVPPFYYKFSLEEIKRYYLDIADSCDLPVILYNFPAFTGVTLDTKTAGELFRDDRFIGIKHTSTDLYQLERMKASDPNLTILNGHDEVFVGSLALGADGAIGSTFNFMAEKFVQMRALFAKGKVIEAYKLQQEANSMISVLVEVGVFQAIKHILERDGIECGNCRPPFRALNTTERTKIDEAVSVARLTTTSDAGTR